MLDSRGLSVLWQTRPLDPGGDEEGFYELLLLEFLDREYYQEAALQRRWLILRVKRTQFQRVLSCKGGLLPMYLLHRARVHFLPLIPFNFLTQEHSQDRRCPPTPPLPRLWLKVLQLACPSRSLGPFVRGCLPRMVRCVSCQTVAFALVPALLHEKRYACLLARPLRRPPRIHGRRSLNGGGSEASRRMPPEPSG